MKYPLTFKAAVLSHHNRKLEIKKVTFNGPLDVGQVLVRIHFSGICGKQIEEIQGTRPDPFLPHLLGHEGSGVVEDAGPGVKKVKKGDHVVLHWVKGSGIDAAAPNYCIGDKKVNAGPITTFNEYGVIAENRMTVISDEADLKLACLLGCAVTTGLGVVLNDATVRPNESVAVFGCGGVGLNIIQGAGLVNAYPIIAVDVHEENLALARRLGATHLIHSRRENVLEEVKKITLGQGARHVMIALAQPEATELAVQTSAMPGDVYFIGVPPSDSTIAVNPLDIHRRRKLAGNWGGNTYPDTHIPLYWNLYERGKINLKELITREESLDDINDGIDGVISGNSGRCVIKLC